MIAINSNNQAATATFEQALAIACRHCHSAFSVYCYVVNTAEMHFLLLFPVLSASIHSKPDHPG
jgi:hypothetical protein